MYVFLCSEIVSEVWAAPLADGSIAVVLLNLSGASRNVTAFWTNIGMPATQSASVRDLWARKVVGTFTAMYSAMIVSHGSSMVRVIPE